jgi:polyamine oxidase
MKGRQIPQELVEKVGKVFETILKEVFPPFSANNAHSIQVVIFLVIDLFFCNTCAQTEKLREETNEDISIAKAITIALERNPHLRFVLSSFCLCGLVNIKQIGYLIGFHAFNRQEGIAHEVIQWYLCRMEGWFATDADSISLQGWDQVVFFYLLVAMANVLAQELCR